MQYYDKDEKQIIESVENEEWISVKDKDSLQEKLQAYAKEDNK